MQTTLAEDVRADPPELEELMDEDTIATLGITKPEVIVLGALILAGGDGFKAAQIARHKGMKPALVDAAVASLTARELIATDGEGHFTFEGAELRLRTLGEDEAEDLGLLKPGTKLVPRSFREEVLMLARSGRTPAEGVGRAYRRIFGGALGSRDYPVLGLIAKELGRDQAALFFLEHATYQYKHPLNELVGLARARAKGFRPADAPDEQQQRDWFAMIAQQAKMKRTSS
jgi:hypothetical protein